jgi:hypothetical protein
MKIVKIILGLTITPFLFYFFWGLYRGFVGGFAPVLAGITVAFIGFFILGKYGKQNIKCAKCQELNKVGISEKRFVCVNCGTACTLK